MSDETRPGVAPWLEAMLTRPRLPLWLGLLGAALTAPSLGIGFHLDDYVHRFVYSGSQQGERLLRAYGSPFGIANGDPESNLWQIESGYAPWWMPEDLLVSPLRPLSAWTHRLDAQLWPDSALAMHAHSVLWYFALCLVSALMFRALLGRESPLAGLCALLYATDYTHGFAVGWIANRNAVIAAAVGVASLWLYLLARASPARARDRPLLLASALLLGVALFCGEGALAIFGYLVAHALCLDRRAPSRRALSLLPHAIVIVVWRLAYRASGSGASGSGLYLDPARDPARYLQAALERVPLVLAGELGTPPAQTPLFVAPELGTAMLVFSVLVSIWLAAALWPLLRRDPIARFFALGMAVSIVPACATHPHSRLFYFVGLGAMGLLARLWYGVMEGDRWVPTRAPWAALGYWFAKIFMGFHLLISPLMLPVMACSVAVSAPIQRGVESAMSASGDDDLVILSAPEYFYVKLIPIELALAGKAAPRRLRALSFGAVPLTVTRPDAFTLIVRFEGGLLRQTLLKLYRDPADPLPAGSSIVLDGLRIEVLDSTPDDHILSVRFTFDRSLSDPRFRFLYWDRTRYAPYRPPAVGQTDRLPAAEIGLGL